MELTTLLTELIALFMEATKSIERTTCRVYSRVNGWYTPVDLWNKGKVAEWNDREEYSQNDK
jgi:hypothetical protein